MDVAMFPSLRRFTAFTKYFVIGWFSNEGRNDEVNLSLILEEQYLNIKNREAPNNGTVVVAGKTPLFTHKHCINKHK